MLVVELLLIWFALSTVAAFAFGAFIRAGRGPEPSAPPGWRIALARSAAPQPESPGQDSRSRSAQLDEPNDDQRSPRAAA